MNSSISYKVILLGDSGVGKTSISYRIKHGSFIEIVKMTLGVGFRVLNFKRDGKSIVIQLWDILGHMLKSLHEFIRSQYNQGANGVILTFDITRRETFANIPKWLETIEDKSPIKVLIGNKSDLKEEREVTIEEAEKFAEEHDLFYIETSAKDGSNINQIFSLMLDELFKLKEN